MQPFTSNLRHDLGQAVPPSISLLAWDLSYRLAGRKTPLAEKHHTLHHFHQYTHEALHPLSHEETPHKAGLYESVLGKLFHP